MDKTFNEILSEILEQVRTNILAYRYTEVYSIDDITDAAKFVDDCSWALSFGGSFKDEIIKVASEVLEEADDSNRS